MYSRQITCIVQFPVKPEAIEQFKQKLFSALDLMALEPDFLCAWFYEDANDPNTFVLLESWKCMGAEVQHDQILRSRRDALEAALPNLLSAPKRTRFLHEIRSYRGVRG